MKRDACGRQDEVAGAVRASRLEGALEEHASACRGCGEVAAVAGFLGALARQPQEAVGPDPGELYRRARLLEKLLREPAPIESAMHKLALGQVLGVMVSGLALLSWLAWTGSELAQRFLQGQAPSIVAWLASPHAVAGVLVLASLAASLPLLAMSTLLQAED